MAERFAAFWWQDLRGALAPVPIAVEPCGDRVLLGWAGLSGSIALALYLLGGYHTGFALLNSLGAVQPQWPWELVTVLGDERTVFALALLGSRRNPRLFWALALAAVLGTLFTHSLKPLFDAARPPAVLPADALNLIGAGHRRGSFPSGHSVTAALFLGVWFCFVCNRWLRLGLVILAAEIALSRVVVGVHWPVDVAAGLMGGFLAAWVGTALSGRWDWGAQPAGHLMLVVSVGLFVVWVTLPAYGVSPGAAWLLRGIGLAALAVSLWHYGLSPWWRWRKHRSSAHPE